MLLRTKRADIEALGARGFTAASYLYGNSRPNVQQTEFIEILASHSFSHFNAEDRDGWTVLHRAAAWGTSADIKALLRMKVSTNHCTRRLNWSPLFCAVGYKNFDTLQALWENDSSPDVQEGRDIRGWNLLHVAAGYGNLEAVPYLLERGVSLDATSTATSRFVPPSLRGKCVTPSEVARNCGEETYLNWTEMLQIAGHAVDVRPEEVNWAFENVDRVFGGCECCDN